MSLASERCELSSPQLAECRAAFSVAQSPYHVLSHCGRAMMCDPRMWAMLDTKSKQGNILAYEERAVERSRQMPEKANAGPRQDVMYQSCLAAFGVFGQHKSVSVCGLWTQHSCTSTAHSLHKGFSGAVDMNMWRDSTSCKQVDGLWRAQETLVLDVWGIRPIAGSSELGVLDSANSIQCLSSIELSINERDAKSLHGFEAGIRDKKEKQFLPKQAATLRHVSCQGWWADSVRRKRQSKMKKHKWKKRQKRLRRKTKASQGAR
jgi:hypothetical protein